MKCNVGLLFKSKFLDQTGMHSAKIYFAYPKREIVNSYFLCVKNLKRNRIKNTDPDKSFMGWQPLKNENNIGLENKIRKQLSLVDQFERKLYF